MRLTRTSDDCTSFSSSLMIMDVQLGQEKLNTGDLNQRFRDNLGWFGIRPSGPCLPVFASLPVGSVSHRLPQPRLPRIGCH